MVWEFLGKQELVSSESPHRGHVYAPLLWRTPVPGGWLLMALNSKTNDPQPTVSFYPDADHVWVGKEPPEAAYLLRPAGAGTPTPSETLLRPAQEESSEPKRLEG